MCVFFATMLQKKILKLVFLTNYIYIYIYIYISNRIIQKQDNIFIYNKFKFNVDLY